MNTSRQELEARVAQAVQKLFSPVSREEERRAEEAAAAPVL